MTISNMTGHCIFRRTNYKTSDTAFNRLSSSLVDSVCGLETVVLRGKSKAAINKIRETG